MKKGYKGQVLNHNIEKFSQMVKDDMDIFSNTKILMQTNQNVILQIQSMSGTKEIKEQLK